MYEPQTIVTQEPSVPGFAQSAPSAAAASPSVLFSSIVEEDFNTPAESPADLFASVVEGDDDVDASEGPPPVANADALFYSCFIVDGQEPMPVAGAVTVDNGGVGSQVSL